MKKIKNRNNKSLVDKGKQLREIKNKKIAFTSILKEIPCLG